MIPRPLRNPALFLAIALIPAGCATEVDTTYGKTRGQSINGVGTFAEVLRQQGHEVRGAVRLTETLGDWADVVVRISERGGRPGREEGEWMLEWLRAGSGRKVVYVVRDYDSESEFWAAMLAAEPSNASPGHVRQVERNRDHSKSWAGETPREAKETAKDEEWFALRPKPPLPSTCKSLEGPWAEGIDAKAAAITKHDGFKASESEPVLLSGDGLPLVISWTLDNRSEVLALANGSFLLNAALLNHARRPLATRVVDWIGPDAENVAIVMGRDPAADQGESGATSPFHLFQVDPFGWVATHILIFLSLIALVRAVRLGRPRPEPPSGVERPSAHPEALGLLLARTGRADAARFLIETYRRWRHPSHAPGRKAPAPPPSR